jgi:hypothetical protein
MKKTFSILVAIILFATASQAQTLSSFTATQQAQIKAALKSTADSVRAEYKAAIANQVTDSSKAATVLGRVKAIEKFNTITAIYPDTLSSFAVKGNILYTKAVDLNALKNTIDAMQLTVDTLSKTVGDNKALFDALKARIDNLKLIFQIQ